MICIYIYIYISVCMYICIHIYTHINIKPRGGGLDYLHRSPASRKMRPKKEPSARGYNWATLFLGDINTGTWPSRLGKSQMRK
jgi:hypothetical protein